MAITQVGGGQSNNTNNAATYTTSSVNNVIGALSIGLGCISDTVLDAIFTDSLGGNWSLLVGEPFTSGVPMMGYIALRNTIPGATTAMDVTMDVTGDNGTGNHLTIRNLSGARATPPFFRQVGFGTGAGGTTPTVVMPAAIHSANGVFGMVVSSAIAAGFVTPPSGWTEVLDQVHSFPSQGFEYCHRLSGETLQTIAWGSTCSTAWLAAIIEIYEAAESPNIPRIVHHRNQMAD